MAEAESVICTLVLTAVHRSDVSSALRNTRWSERHQDASPICDDEDSELIVRLSIASLQEAEEALRITSKIPCRFGRQLCFVARGEKIAHVNLCDSGKWWQELSGSFY